MKTYKVTKIFCREWLIKSFNGTLTTEPSPFTERSRKDIQALTHFKPSSLVGLDVAVAYEPTTGGNLQRDGISYAVWRWHADSGTWECLTKNKLYRRLLFEDKIPAFS